MEQTCNNTQQVGEQVGTGILSGDESGTGQVIAASHSQQVDQDAPGASMMNSMMMVKITQEI